MKTFIGLRDSENTYNYVVASEDNDIYVLFPDFCPECFTTVQKYNVHLSTYNANIEHTLLDVDFSMNEVLAMKKLRFNEDDYRQYIYLGSITWPNENIYCSLRVLNDDGSLNTEFTPGQGCLYKSTHSITWMPECEIKDNAAYLEFGMFPLEEIISSGIKPSKFTYKIKVYVNDDTQCYDRITTDVLPLPETSDELEMIPFKTLLRKFTDMNVYKPGLRLQAVLNIYDVNDDIFMSYRSVPYILTPLKFAEITAMLEYAEENKGADLPNIHDILDNMELTRPKIFNKTVQNVIEMSSVENNRRHIVQPVFFRVRELNKCTFHPRVSENICINLDTYKSAVESFTLQLEGVLFKEIGRVKAGVVFRVNGNLLPGALDEGTFYILNEDSDLVTTGKYTYEY